MTDNTSQHTIVLDRGYFIDVQYNANTHTITAEMYTRSTQRVIVYTEKFAHPINYVKKAVEECAKMVDAYDSAVRVLEKR